jgi:hypothetical protein
LSKSAKTESRVSSVSLTDETWEIAKSMPNFSSFVRECLIRWRYEHQADKSRHLHPMQIGRNPRTNHIEYTICYPHSKLGLCLLCWPEGAPTTSDWVEWVQGWRFDHHRGISGAGKPITRIQTLARENNTREAFHMTDFDFKRKNSAKAENPARKNWSRILAVLRFWD